MFSSKPLRSLLPLRRLLHLSHSAPAKKLPDPWDLMTGKELFFALQHAKGNVDPLHILPLKRGPGTKDCPNVVYSFLDKRIVGCVCNEDACHTVFFWLVEGFPRRCDCNHWFVLERVEMPRAYEDG